MASEPRLEPSPMRWGRGPAAGSGLRTAAAWALALALLVALALYARDRPEILRSLLEVSALDLALLAAAWLLLSLPRSLIRKLMARRLGAELRFVDWYGLGMVSNLIALVVPARGDYLLSAAYLKRRYGLAISHFASMVYGNAVVMAGILGVEGCLVLLAMGVVHGRWSGPVLAFMGALVLAAAAAAMLSTRLVPGRGWLGRRLRTAIAGWQWIRDDRPLLLSVTALMAASTVIFAAWMYLGYRALGFEVRLLPVVFAGLVSQASFFVNLTPGNLGVREALVAFASEVMGLGFAEGAAVTLLQRALSSLIFLLLGGGFGAVLFRELLASRPPEEAAP